MFLCRVCRDAVHVRCVALDELHHVGRVVRLELELPDVALVRAHNEVLRAREAIKRLDGGWLRRAVARSGRCRLTLPQVARQLDGGLVQGHHTIEVLPDLDGTAAAAREQRRLRVTAALAHIANLEYLHRVHVRACLRFGWYGGIDEEPLFGRVLHRLGRVGRLLLRLPQVDVAVRHARGHVAVRKELAAEHVLNDDVLIRVRLVDEAARLLGPASGVVGVARLGVLLPEVDKLVPEGHKVEVLAVVAYLDGIPHDAIALRRHARFRIRAVQELGESPLPDEDGGGGVAARGDEHLATLRETDRLDTHAPLVRLTWLCLLRWFHRVEVLARFGAMREAHELLHRVHAPDRYEWVDILPLLGLRDRPLPGRAVVARLVHRDREHALSVPREEALIHLVELAVGGFGPVQDDADRGSGVDHLLGGCVEEVGC